MKLLVPLADTRGLPVLKVKEVRLALFDKLRATIIAYNFVVVWSDDFTDVSMVVVAPAGFSITGLEATPLATGVPLTVMEALASLAIGFTVTDAVPILTAVV